jgi:glycosyltransferase involved in cell wall biosynthesis
MTSVIIAFRNDIFIWFTINALLKGTDHAKFEIIIIDDYSDPPLQVNNELYPNILLIRHNTHMGVGQCFDDGVKNCKYENIVLMGSDVLVKDSSWLNIAEDFITNNSKSIGCSVCLSGDPNHLDPLNPADDIKRYGATIMPFCTSEDLSSDSPLLDLDTYHVDMFETKWRKSEPFEDFPEVPCVYGAFYVTNKSWYNKIHGWDNSHKIWGGLEAWISIKSWLYGGACHVIKSLETLHVFHKFMYENSDNFVASGSFEKYWYNKMFIAYTVLPFDEADSLLKKVYETRAKYELHTRQFNLGKQMISQNWVNISAVNKLNYRESVINFNLFCDVFNIKKVW